MTRLARLQAINFKKLTEVDITLSGFNKITGANGNGKSSVLDAVRFALQGGRALPDVPIRAGEDRAEVIATFDDGRTVTRRISAKGTTVELRSADGAKFDKPQSLLDGETGVLSFDPLLFLSKPPANQVRDLLAIAAPEFDLDEAEGTRRAVFSERTMVGRQVKMAEGQLDGLGPAVAAPFEELSTADVFGELRAAQRIEAEAASRTTALAQVDREIADQREVLNRARARLDSLLEDRAGITQTIAAAPAVPDIEALTVKLRDLDSTNAAVRHNHAVTRAVTAVAKERDKYTALSKRLLELDRAKADVLAGAKFPIDGLGFTDEQVTYNGVPLSQASSAEQLRVSMAIATAANPSMRVVLIQNGSLLDSVSLADVERIAQETDTQVLIELVEESGDVGIVIVDGAVAS